MTAMQSPPTTLPIPASDQESSDVENLAVANIKVPATDSPRPIHGWRWGLAGKHVLTTLWRKTTDKSPVSAILSSVFFFSLDQTVVADIIPDIVEHFGEVQKLPWISVTLLLAAAGTINFWYSPTCIHSPTLGFEF